MKNSFRHVNSRLLLGKALLYRLLSGTFTFFGTLFFTKDISFSIQISVFVEVIKTGFYFAYDYFFTKKYKISKDEGFVLFFTGLPCSGKTTIAKEMEKYLKNQKRNVERLDGDTLRSDICKDLGFSKEDRSKNLDRVRYLSSILSRNGVAVLASFVSPYIKDREKIRNNTTNFIEVFVDADATTCCLRDVKGMWAKALRGEIKGFTGVDDPYEKPINPEIHCVTEKETLKESKEKILNYLKKRKLI